MSSHDHRYDKSASWKSHRKESSSRDSPERYRNRDSGSPSRRYHSPKDSRRYYENLNRYNAPYPKRYSFDGSRIRYHRKPETSDDRKQDGDKKPEVPTAERDSRNSITKPSVNKFHQVVPTAEKDSRSTMSKSTWSNSSSSSRGPAVTPTPSKPAWLMECKAPAIKTPPVPDSSAQTNFNLIFQHINAVCVQNDHQTQQDRPMSFIDRIIADEAMRMLSAASSREATSLNEPCQEATETLPSSAPVSEGTEASKQQEENVINASKLADKAAKVSAADSALLQKSAEQVTKKLINQLSTMNKYDLKQMIDNPAGKYETALNKHAQSKLRAEVRKQLKGFALGKLGSAFVHGDGTVESDEAIDADKIPSALLEQIGHVLDLDIFNISHTVSPESIEQLPEVLESAPSKSKNEPKGDHDHYALMCAPASTDNGTQIVKPSVDNVSGSPSKKTPTKKANILKPSPLTPGRVKKIIIRKPNATLINRGVVREPVASTLQRKTTNPLPKNKFSVPASIASVPPAMSQVITPVQNLSYVSQIRHSTSEDTDTNMTMNSRDNVNPSPGVANSGVKNVSFLRINTVEELNRRLDEPQHMKSVESQQVLGSALNRGPSQKDISEQTTKMNDKLDGISSTANEKFNTNPAKLPGVELVSHGTESAAKNKANVDHSLNEPRLQSQSPVLATVQQQEQPNLSSLQRRNGNNMNKTSNRFSPFPPTKEQTKPVNNTNGDNRILNTIGEKAKAIEDKPMAPAISAAHPHNSTGPPRKKRKVPKNNGNAPSMVTSVPSSNNTTSTHPPVQSVSPNMVCQTNGSSTIAKSAKKRKKRKASLLGPSMNTETANNVTNVPDMSTKERIPALPSTEVPQVEDRTLNDQLLSKSFTDPTPEPVAQQTHITITNVCSMANPEELSTPSTAVTANGTTGGTEKACPDLQLPQETSVTEPKKETSSLEHPEPNVPNFETSDCSDQNMPGWNLPTEPTVDEDIERIASPQTILERMTDEYILGGDSGNAIQPEIQAQQAANHSATPLPSHCTERLQSLCGVIEHMQSIEAQTMELYNRKMAIDALFMQLHTERMDIDQRLERLHNIRREQMNFMRHNLLELATNNSSIESTMQPPSFVMSDSGLAGLNGAVPANQAAGGRQQERTIRRITPIGGNSVLMKIFQRRRAPSERSTDENPPVDLT